LVSGFSGLIKETCPLFSLLWKTLQNIQEAILGLEFLCGKIFKLGIQFLKKKLYEFSEAAVTNYHKFYGLKQCKFTAMVAHIYNPSTSEAEAGGR
jgi:hypothetical protein